MILWLSYLLALSKSNGNFIPPYVRCAHARGATLSKSMLNDNEHVLQGVLQLSISQIAPQAYYLSSKPGLRTSTYTVRLLSGDYYTRLG